MPSPVLRFEPVATPTISKLCSPRSSETCVTALVMTAACLDLGVEEEDHEPLADEVGDRQLLAVEGPARERGQRTLLAAAVARSPWARAGPCAAGAGAALSAGAPFRLRRRFHSGVAAPEEGRRQGEREEDPENHAGSIRGRPSVGNRRAAAGPRFACAEPRTARRRGVRVRRSCLRDLLEHVDARRRCRGRSRG